MNAYEVVKKDAKSIVVSIPAANAWIRCKAEKDELGKYIARFYVSGAVYTPKQITEGLKPAALKALEWAYDPKHKKQDVSNVVAVEVGQDGKLKLSPLNNGTFDEMKEYIKFAVSFVTKSEGKNARSKS